MFQFFSSCPVCGFSLPPIFYLCRGCWATLQLKKRGFIYDVHRWPLLSLWEWKDFRSEEHSLLLRRKKRSLFVAEERLARWLTQALLEVENPKWDGVFYPAKKVEKHDHAWHLASAVGSQLGLPVTGIEVARSPVYKRLSRRERILERSKITAGYGGGYVLRPLLVDDVVTTGATMNALWSALGQPEYAFGLSLAYKTFNSGDKI